MGTEIYTVGHSNLRQIQIHLISSHNMFRLGQVVSGFGHDGADVLWTMGQVKRQVVTYHTAGCI